MAKGRMLLNRISNSKKLADLKTDTARLLYTWILSHLDANGCFYADPSMVNNLVFTRLGKSKAEIASCLEDLNRVNLIVFYEKNGEKYLQFPDFTDKQINLRPDREGKSVIPKPKKEEIIPYSGITPELLPPNIIEDKLIEENIKAQAPPLDESLIEEISKKSETLYRLKIFPKVVAWVNTQNKKGKNPKAILHCLESCLKNKPPGDPWPWMEAAMKDEDKNYNAADFDQKAAKDKCDFIGLVNGIKKMGGVG